jgi:hypothetical protein
MYLSLSAVRSGIRMQRRRHQRAPLRQQKVTPL